jgi:hypothetical protein
VNLVVFGSLPHNHFFSFYCLDHLQNFQLRILQSLASFFWLVSLPWLAIARKQVWSEYEHFPCFYLPIFLCLSVPVPGTLKSENMSHPYLKIIFFHFRSQKDSRFSLSPTTS